MAETATISLVPGSKEKLKERGLSLSEICQKAVADAIGETPEKEDLKIELAGLESEWAACKKEDVAVANKIHALLLPFRENHDAASFLKTLINNYHVGKGGLVVE